MQTRSSLQRRNNSESSDRVVVNLKPRSWGDETHEQPQTVQPKPSGFDFKNVDWFSHDPGPRSPVRVFNSIQAKLTVGAPNDQYEQEADRVADQVMNTPDSAIQQTLQREAMPEEEELQTKSLPLVTTITPLSQRGMALKEEGEDGFGGILQRQKQVPASCANREPDFNGVAGIINNAYGGSRSNTYPIDKLQNAWFHVRNQREEPGGANCCSPNLPAAEHYLYARYAVANRDHSSFEMKALIWGYGYFKYLVRKTGICPKSPDTQGSRDWGYLGADNGATDLFHQELA